MVYASATGGLGQQGCIERGHKVGVIVANVQRRHSTDVLAGLLLFKRSQSLCGIKTHPRVNSGKQGCDAGLVIEQGILQFLERVKGRICTAQQISLEGIEQGGDLGGREGGGGTGRVGIVNDSDTRQGRDLAAQLIDGADQVGFVGGGQVRQRADLTVNGLELGGKA
jgi:hypothetical protein